jgi:hypothetical protein
VQHRVAGTDHAGVRHDHRPARARRNCTKDVTRPSACVYDSPPGQAACT